MGTLEMVGQGKYKYTFSLSDLFAHVSFALFQLSQFLRVTSIY